MSSVNLTNHFLIAMPGMADPYFARTLTYVCQHDDSGALGVVVNRPLELTLDALLKQVEIPHSGCTDIPVYFGGPVQMDRGFVLFHPLGVWETGVRSNSAIGFTASKDILHDVGRGAGPSRLLVTLGYAGWEPGQLEHELSLNAWLSVEAQRSVIFDLPPEERLPAAMQLLGVSFASLSDEVGHA
jgi:putative transcriptional regulator